MPAATLNCPSCGASLSPDSTSCPYCNTRLATISCPSCFGLAFLGSKFCPHCGQALASATTAATHLLCPRCRIPLEDLNLGHIQLRNCEECCGIWVDTATFQKICADREEQAAVLGSPTPVQHDENSPRRSYIPCPQCGQIMTPTQFSRRSGVIIDICRAHGIWFDAEELRHIIEFIRAGGLDRARAIEKDELDRERREIEAKMRDVSHEERLTSIASTGGILGMLLRDA